MEEYFRRCSNRKGRRGHCRRPALPNRQRCAGCLEVDRRRNQRRRDAMTPEQRQAWALQIKTCRSRNPIQTRAKDLRSLHQEIGRWESFVWARILLSSLTQDVIIGLPNDYVGYRPRMWKGSRTMQLGHLNHNDRPLSPYWPMSKPVNMMLGERDATPENLKRVQEQCIGIWQSDPYVSLSRIGWMHTDVCPETGRGIGGLRDVSPAKAKQVAKKTAHERRLLDRLWRIADKLYARRVRQVLKRRAA